MAASFKFYDEKGVELSHDPVTGGVDFSTVKILKSKTVPFKIRNTGDTSATDCEIGATTYHSLGEVSESEYQKELLAKNWKSFSFSPTSDFSPTLNIGTIEAGQFAKGMASDLDDFTKDNGIWTKEDMGSGTSSYSPNGLYIDGGAEGNAVSFKTLFTHTESLDECIAESTVKFSHAIGWTKQNSFIMFVFRKNSNGDNFGYNVMAKVNNTDGQFMFDVRRESSGFTSTGSLSAGAYATRWESERISHKYGDVLKLKIKMSKSETGKPKFEIFVNDRQLNFVVKEGAACSPESAYVDELNTYPNAGVPFFAYCGYYGGSFDVKNLNLSYPSNEGVLYVKTEIGEEAKDKTNYLSALELSYNELI